MRNSISCTQKERGTTSQGTVITLNLLKDNSSQGVKNQNFRKITSRNKFISYNQFLTGYFQQLYPTFLFHLSYLFAFLLYLKVKCNCLSVQLYGLNTHAEYFLFWCDFFYLFCSMELLFCNCALSCRYKGYFNNLFACGVCCLINK